MAELKRLSIAESTQFAWFYYNFVPTAMLIGADYIPAEIGDIISPPEIFDRTRYAKTWGLPEGYVALSSGEGEGFVLYKISTEEVFDVGVEEFPKLEACEVKPIFNTFLDFMLSYTAVR